MAPKKGAAPPAPEPEKTICKILMLHGYTQSGPSFRAKTRAVERIVAKQLAPLGLVPQLIYPTGPVRLRPDHIPGYRPPEDAPPDGPDGPAELDAWAWWRHDEASATYANFGPNMATLAEPIAAAGGIDGVLGFSQGAAAAVLLAAALELPYRTPSDPAQAAWAEAVRAANGHRGLRFAVMYSGFFTPPADLAWLYSRPIATPTLHYMGSLDSIVIESRSQALVDKCIDPVVVIHPGGHYVPLNKQWVLPLAVFLKDHGGLPVADKPEEKPESAAPTAESS